MSVWNAFYKFYTDEHYAALEKKIINDDFTFILCAFERYVKAHTYPGRRKFLPEIIFVTI